MKMNLDGYLLLWIQDNLRSDALTPFLRAVTFLGDNGWIWIILAAFLLLFRRTRRAGISVAIALVLSLLVNNLWLKPWIDRVRPYEVIEGLRILIDPPHDASFPSGHTGASFAAAVALFPYVKRPAAYGAILLAAAIAVSRLYLGVHYPTDVIGGLVIGIALGCLAARIARGKATPHHGK